MKGMERLLREILIWRESGYWTHRFKEDFDLTDKVLQAFGSQKEALALLRAAVNGGNDAE